MIPNLIWTSMTFKNNSEVKSGLYLKRGFLIYLLHCNWVSQIPRRWHTKKNMRKSLAYIVCQSSAFINVQYKDMYCSGKWFRSNCAKKTCESKCTNLRETYLWKYLSLLISDYLLACILSVGVRCYAFKYVQLCMLRP